jgi:uncharacterized protein YqeY
MMGIKKDIEKALHTAIIDGNKNSKNALRLTLSSIKLAEIEKGEPLEEIRIINILQKEIKTREETISEALKADREEIIEALENEINALKCFLPAELSDNELKNLVGGVIDELNASSIKQMGLVMKSVIEKAQGRASNERISKFVRGKMSPE